MTEELKCRWCNAGVNVVAYGAKARWILDNAKNLELSKLVSCSRCGILFFVDGFSASELEKMYSGYRGIDYLKRRRRWEPWYTRRINDAIGGSSEVIEHRRGHLAELLKKALGEGAKSPTAVLDFGGDVGQFIPEIETIQRRAVFEVSGLDPIRGLRTIGDWAEAGLFEPDLIMICHVLEHVTEPRQLIESAARVLTRNGLLYIEVPLDVPMGISKAFAGSGYRRYTAWLCRHPRFFVFADLISLLSKRFIGRPVVGSVIKQSEHINYFSGLAIQAVVSELGFSLIAESVYSPSTGVPVLDVDAVGLLFKRN